MERKEWSDKQVKKYRDDSEKAFQEGVDLVDTWAYKDKAGYDKAVKAKNDLLSEVDALDIKFIDNESPEVSKFKDLLRKQLEKESTQSGVTSNAWAPNGSPILPQPVITSSNTRTMSYLSQASPTKGSSLKSS